MKNKLIKIGNAHYIDTSLKKFIHQKRGYTCMWLVAQESIRIDTGYGNFLYMKEGKPYSLSYLSSQKVPTVVLKKIKNKNSSGIVFFGRKPDIPLTEKYTT